MLTVVVVVVVVVATRTFWRRGGGVGSGGGGGGGCCLSAARRPLRRARFSKFLRLLCFFVVSCCCCCFQHSLVVAIEPLAVGIFAFCCFFLRHARATQCGRRLLSPPSPPPLSLVTAIVGCCRRRALIAARAQSLVRSLAGWRACLLQRHCCNFSRRVHTLRVSDRRRRTFSSARKCARLLSRFFCSRAGGSCALNDLQAATSDGGSGCSSSSSKSARACM